MIRLLLLLWMALPASAAEPLARSVVRVLTTYQAHDPLNPWNKRTPSSRVHQGVVIGEHTILTTAMAVRDATLIRVEALGGPDRVTARVALVDPDIDLALLTVDDPEFFDAMTPVSLAPRMPTSGTVTTAAWRTGQLQVVEGRVVRIGVRASATGHVVHPTLEINTDMPSGGSSEPVFRGRRLLGLTTQQSDANATVQGVELLRDFLDLAERETYPGMPVFGARYQTLKSSAEAMWLGMQEPNGVLIRSAPAGSSACGALQPRDVLLAVDGMEIDGNGKVEHPRYGLLEFTYLLAHHHAVGDTISIRRLRKGEVQTDVMTLRAGPPSLSYVPGHRYDHAPGYVIVGGLVLIEFDHNFVSSFSKRHAPSVGMRNNILVDLDGTSQTSGRRRAIVIANVMPDAYNVGYHHVRHSLVRSINGQEIDSLEDVLTALESPEDGFVVLDISAPIGDRQVVLDAAGLDEANARIQETYQVGALSRMAEPPPPLTCEP